MIILLSYNIEYYLNDQYSIMDLVTPVTNNNISEQNYGSIDIYKPTDQESVYCQIINIINYVNFEPQKTHKQCLMCKEMLEKLKKDDSHEEINVEGTYKKEEDATNSDAAQSSNGDAMQSSNEDICPICLNADSGNLVYSICTDLTRNISRKHFSCYSCIVEWIKTNKDSCPTCRSQIKTLYCFHPKYISHTIELSKYDGKTKLVSSTEFDFEQIEKDFFPI